VAVKQQYPITEQKRTQELVEAGYTHQLSKSLAIGSVSGAVVSGLFLHTTLLPEIFAGLSVVFVSWYFIGVFSKKETPQKREMSESLFRERSTRVLAVLQQEGACTIEDLLDKTDFFEKALVPTLKKMVDLEWIEEELEMETGKWYFKISNQYHEIRTNQNIGRDLDSRLNELDR